MSDPGCVILLGDTDARIYTDRRGGPAIVPALFHEGPDRLIDSVTGNRSNFDSANRVEDNCEAGCIVDTVRRTLRFFHVEWDCLPVRNMLLRTLNCRWSGWSIQWADNGVFDLLGAATRNGTAPHPGRPLSNPPTDLTMRFKMTPEDVDVMGDFGRYAVVTVVGDGVSHHCFGDTDVLDVLQVGSELVSRLSPEKRTRPREACANAGGVLYVERRQLDYWSCRVPVDESQAVWSDVDLIARWPGWKVGTSPLGLAEQMQRAGAPENSFFLMSDAAIRNQVEERLGADVDWSMIDK